MIKDYLENEVISNYDLDKELVIRSNKKNISKLIGNKKSNKNYIMKKFGHELKIEEKNIDEEQIHILIDQRNILKVSMSDIYSKLFSVYNL